MSIRKASKKDEALRYARRIIAAERKSQFECFTIPPKRSFDQMDEYEARAIRQFDRALAKIDEALK